MQFNDTAYPAAVNVPLAQVPEGDFVRINGVYYIRGAPTSTTQVWLYNTSSNTAQQADMSTLVERVGYDPVVIHAPA